MCSPSSYTYKHSIFHILLQKAACVAMDTPSQIGYIKLPLSHTFCRLDKCVMVYSTMAALHWMVSQP